MSVSSFHLFVARIQSSRRLWRTLRLVGGVCALWLTFAACSSSEEPGMEVTVTMGVDPVVGTDGSLELYTDTGYTVTLDRAYLSVGAIEIHGCEESASGALLHWFGPRLALAHGVSSPTRIGAPLVVSLLAKGDTPEVFGTLLPPPGQYCSTRVELAAADSDARGLPDDLDMVGATLEVAGTWSNAGDSAREFELRTSTTQERTIDQAFNLSRDERQRTLALRAIVEHAFDGVDFAEQTENEQVKTVLSNISDGLEVSTQ